MFTFINLTRNWPLPGVNIFWRSFDIHVNWSGSSLRYIKVICEKKRNEISIYNVTPSHGIWIYMNMFKLQLTSCAKPTCISSMFLLITWWYPLSSYSGKWKVIWCYKVCSLILNIPRVKYIWKEKINKMNR